jgi:hypothetical protein
MASARIAQSAAELALFSALERLSLARITAPWPSRLVHGRAAWHPSLGERRQVTSGGQVVGRDVANAGAAMLSGKDNSVASLVTLRDRLLDPAGRVRALRIP